MKEFTIIENRTMCIIYSIFGVLAILLFYWSYKNEIMDIKTALTGIVAFVIVLFMVWFLYRCDTFLINRTHLKITQKGVYSREEFMISIKEIERINTFRKKGNHRIEFWLQDKEEPLIIGDFSKKNIKELSSFLSEKPKMQIEVKKPFRIF